MTKKRTAARPKPARAEIAPGQKVPLIEHIKELRRRLFYIAASVAVGSAIAYGFEHQILDFLLRPSHGQDFIYTSPMGGMNFLFTVCLDIGLVAATPVIIYQILAFLRPLMRNTTRKFLLIASGAAGLVAFAGVAFGYFIGLPSALHFLLHQFTTVQVRPLITIQSYMQFVALYLLGCALMFQLPLIILLINRIKPLKPSSLFKYERHLIVGAIVAAFIMNPSPNIIDQAFVVIPIIASYQLSIFILWAVQRSNKPTQVQLLLQQDAERRAERINRELTPLTIPAPTFDEIAERQLDSDEDQAQGQIQPLLTPVPVPVMADPAPQEPATIPESTATIESNSVTEPAAALATEPNPTEESEDDAVAIKVRTPNHRPVTMHPTPRRMYVPLRGGLVQ